VRHGVPARGISALIVLLAAGLALIGCGASGTWDDDPENWDRAFQSTMPPCVVVVHSHYWRSPHWSFEFQYFFHIRRNSALKEQLFTENTLVQLEEERATDAASDFFGEKPSWFLPETPRGYAVWVFADDPESMFRVFVDEETGDLFLTDYIV